MGTFHIFGVPVTFGFDNDIVEKFDHYNELYAETCDDDAPVKDWDVHRQKISEQVDLFYELQSEGVNFDEPEERSGGNWFSRWFG